MLFKFTLKSTWLYKCTRQYNLSLNMKFPSSTLQYLLSFFLHLRSISEAFHSDILPFQWRLWEDCYEIILDNWPPVCLGSCKCQIQIFKLVKGNSALFNRLYCMTWYAVYNALSWDSQPKAVMKLQNMLSIHQHSSYYLSCAYFNFTIEQHNLEPSNK